MSDNYFEKLAKINVSDHIEKKGGFSYLSWPFAVQELGKVDPSATWEVKRHNGMPYIETPLGYFVEVAVTCMGVTKSQIHPVLDNRNKPIQKPTPFDINTSIQRALVKAIALHGLGLYIYAGEDLPSGKEGMSESDLANHKAAIEAASTEEELKAAFAKAYKAAQAIGDTDATTELTAAYNARKPTIRKAA